MAGRWRDGRERRACNKEKPECDGSGPRCILMSYMLPTSVFAIDVPASLLARARAGQPDAFEQLYRWFERPVYTLALRICGDREEAQDVLQDTMLKLIRQIASFRGDGGSPFWGWLRQIAVNESLMRLRSKRTGLMELGDESDTHAMGEDLSPLPPAAADAALLQAALSKLPHATRSVLWLYHAEGYTHDEIAALMQRTTSFSKSQLARGTRRLRAMLHVEEPVHA
jgi:RNA polymerase sigma factor (sigma-70 family)